jgi:hypothetical protein
MPIFGSAFQAASTDYNSELPEPVIVHEKCLDSAFGDKHEEDEDHQSMTPVTSFGDSLAQGLVESLLAQMQAEGQTPTREELERRVNACFSDANPGSATDIQFRVPRGATNKTPNPSRR